jgi:hypothetical protein
MLAREKLRPGSWGMMHRWHVSPLYAWCLALGTPCVLDACGLSCLQHDVDGKIANPGAGFICQAGTRESRRASEIHGVDTKLRASERGAWNWDEERGGK